jgi:hypothetical protein
MKPARAKFLIEEVVVAAQTYGCLPLEIRRSCR